jgi:hypothetical protein
MKIVLEKLTQQPGISHREILRAGANRGGSIKLTAAFFSLGATVVEIKVSG